MTPLSTESTTARATAACAGPNICTACVAPLIVTLLKRMVSGFAGRFGVTTASSVLKPSFWFESALHEGRAGRARLRSDDQVDVRHLVAVADQRLTDEEIRGHLKELPSGKASSPDEILTKCSKRFQQSGRAVSRAAG